MCLLEPALGCQVQSKVELSKVISRVKISSHNKVGSSRGTETHTLFPGLNLIRLEVPVKDQQDKGWFQENVACQKLLGKFIKFLGIGMPPPPFWDKFSQFLL